MALRPYITFRLGADYFALPVSLVREVLDLEAYTRLPLAPECLLGVVNLRGTAIPLVDLRVKFGLSAAAPTPDARILVMELEQDGQRFVVGGLADSVREVIELEQASLPLPPSTGLKWKAEVVESVALVQGQFVVLLRLPAVFFEEDLRALGAGMALRGDLSAAP